MALVMGRPERGIQKILLGGEGCGIQKHLFCSFVGLKLRSIEVQAKIFWEPESFESVNRLAAYYFKVEVFNFFKRSYQ